jgi:hypothetical protein
MYTVKNFLVNVITLGRYMYCVVRVALCMFVLPRIYVFCLLHLTYHYNIYNPLLTIVNIAGSASTIVPKQSYANTY